MYMFTDKTMTINYNTFFCIINNNIKFNFCSILINAIIYDQDKALSFVAVDVDPQLLVGVDECD